MLPEIKQRLGKQVAQCVPAGSTLFLDAGSTLLAVASFLQGPLTIITPSLDIAQQVSDREDIDLILLGGKWDQKQRLFAGSATLSLLSRYRADIAILGACAIHAELGLSASQEADAEVKRAMLAASRGALGSRRPSKTQPVRTVSGVRVIRDSSTVFRSSLGRARGP